jgi:hypothetical protein
MGRPAGIAVAARTATNGSKPMAEAAPNNSALKLTVDDLFQILKARDVPEFEAKKQIFEYSQIGKLPIDSHVAAGACKPSPRRHWANSDEPEVAPDGGITTPINPQSWGRVFELAIRDGHLIVEPLCSLDFPWQAYSFLISNPTVIDEFWPKPASKAAQTDIERPPESIADMEPPAARPPLGASKPIQLAWAYGELLKKKDQLTGLRGKALLEKVCRKVGPNFTASQRTFVRALELHKNRSI